MGTSGGVPPKANLLRIAPAAIDLIIPMGAIFAIPLKFIADLFPQQFLLLKSKAVVLTSALSFQ